MTARVDEMKSMGSVGADTLCTLLERDRARAHEVRRHLRAPATLRAYDSAWRAWVVYCESRGISPLPADPENICAYLVWLGDQRPTPRSLRRRGTSRPTAGRTMSLSMITIAYSSIAMVHRHARAPGWESARSTPALVGEQLDALRRTVGRAPRERKDPIEVVVLRALVGTIGQDLRGIRDRAILLLDFFGCNRRSETAALDVEDVKARGADLIVTVRRSKVDQEGEGFDKGVLAAEREMELCPVHAVQRWLTASGLTEGALFRAVRAGRVVNRRISGRLVANVVKNAARAAGIDDATIARLSSHSLRSGFITVAASRGVDAIAISRQSAHKDLNSLKGYIRYGTLFERNPSKGMI